jgi:3-isopropylmalate/(R)-2-methylmalate dehydratase small subunit
MRIKGRAHKYGDNINTDEIIPAPFLNTTDPKELGSHCMEGIDPGFSRRVRPGDIIVGGKNFGCGSSREHAPISIKGAGVSCVIGESFARIFFRNAINTGLPILISKEASRAIKKGDALRIDTVKGSIEDVTQGRIFNASKFPPFMQAMIRAGGLMRYVTKRSRRAGR